ncbi:MAG TPA: cytidine deaminase [Dongiaceae bacterium]|jgi:cytidine deaminase|nr:cytidine deaminase [Dongiaceae bacterium]
MNDAPAARPPLSDSDHALIRTAIDLINARYVENRHHIAAAVRGRSGKVYTGLHLDTYVGRASVCAEAVAVGQAMAAGESGIEAIVSVRHPRPREQHREAQLVSPCGVCREMLNDFAPGAVVLLAGPHGTERRPVEALLPDKYRRKP